MRAYQDLREFLGVLEQHRQLLRITEAVLPEPDLGDEGSATGHPVVLGVVCVALAGLVLLRSGDRRSLRRHRLPLRVS